MPAIEPHIGEYTPSYTLNENVKYGSDYTNGNFSGQENGTNFSVVQEPASTFLAGDSATFWTSETPFEVERNDDVIAYGQDYPSPNVYGAFDFANRFQADHNGGASVAWLDGHAKHVHIDTTYAGCTPLFAQYVEPCSQVNSQITAANMGDLVYGARGSANAQYYYLLNKPAGL